MTMLTEPATGVAFDSLTFERMLQAYRQRDPRDHAQAWHLLEAMHVLGQPRLVPHAQTHGLKLGRLPLGNSGRSHISAFRPMAVAPALMATIRSFERPGHV